MLLLVSIEVLPQGKELVEPNLSTHLPNFILQGPLNLYAKLENHVHIPRKARDVDIVLSGQFV